MQRQKKVEELKKAGKGTPVTPETFQAWQERKRKEREAKAKKLVETELKKKKGGKGLSVLSGRELYNFKKELFDKVDDDDDGGDDNTNPAADDNVHLVAEKVKSDLFLQGDDDDLDDLSDD